MSKILDIIAEETNGKSFKSYKYSYEGLEIPTLSYDDHEITWEKYGETEIIEKSKNLKEFADKILKQNPLFSYFLDGSRRTFKVDDISYKNEVYPIVAGQISIACCKRENKRMTAHDSQKKVVIALPQIAASQNSWNKEVFLNNLCKKVNEDIYVKKSNIVITDIIKYSDKKDNIENLENRAIAVIQDLMIQEEIKMVTKLVKSKKINRDNYLLKDGSLEYRVDYISDEIEKRKFQSNFNYVIGVSKSFNPENCKDKKGKNNSNAIANLPLYHRTPVNLYTSLRLPGMKYAVWYLRIREKKFTSNAFDGILKIEKILTTGGEIEEVLLTEDVDYITANIINERNPVCYGNDLRWANHLYPIYITESYAKSKYLSNTMFLNIF